MVDGVGERGSDASPEGNARHFAESRQKLEHLLATMELNS